MYIRITPTNKCSLIQAQLNRIFDQISVAPIDLDLSYHHITNLNIDIYLNFFKEAFDRLIIRSINLSHLTMSIIKTYVVSPIQNSSIDIDDLTQNELDQDELHDDFDPYGDEGILFHDLIKWIGRLTNLKSLTLSQIFRNNDNNFSNALDILSKAFESTFKNLDQLILEDNRITQLEKVNSSIFDETIKSIINNDNPQANLEEIFGLATPIIVSILKIKLSFSSLEVKFLQRADLKPLYYLYIYTHSIIDIDGYYKLIQQLQNREAKKNIIYYPDHKTDYSNAAEIKLHNDLFTQICSQRGIQNLTICNLELEEDLLIKILNLINHGFIKDFTFVKCDFFTETVDLMMQIVFKRDIKFNFYFCGFKHNMLSNNYLKDAENLQHEYNYFIS